MPNLLINSDRLERELLTRHLLAAVETLTMKRPSAAHVAKALHGGIIKFCQESCIRLRPEIESFCHDPAASAEHINARLWHVSLEAGPYQWAIAAAFALNDALRARGVPFMVEPQYSFSLVVSAV
jgi:hypothetical protein